MNAFAKILKELHGKVYAAGAGLGIAVFNDVDDAADFLYLVMSAGYAAERYGTTVEFYPE